MNGGDRRMGDARTGVPVELTGNHPQQGATIGRADQGHLATTDVLIARRRHLHVRGEIHPQLHAVEEPALHHNFFGRSLDVQQPSTCGHPLGVAVADQATATMRILMGQGAVDHVGDGLEAAVRMP